MSEYVKTCSFCKKEIKMSDQDRKWHPYNKDGSIHTCNKKQDTPTYTVDVVLKKLESIGIIINVERLMVQ